MDKKPLTVGETAADSHGVPCARYGQPVSPGLPLQHNYNHTSASVNKIFLRVATSTQNFLFLLRLILIASQGKIAPFDQKTV